MRIAAYDPGESTGWAMCTYDPEDCLIVGRVDSGWDSYVTVAKQEFAMMNGAAPFDVVIYETWRLRKDKANEFIGSPIIPIQAVGFTRAAVLLVSPGTPMVGQEPSIKNVIDKQMAGFGYPDYLPAYDGAEHARDAVRHLYYYLVNKKGYRP